MLNVPAHRVINMGWVITSPFALDCLTILNMNANRFHKFHNILLIPNIKGLSDLKPCFLKKHIWTPWKESVKVGVQNLHLSGQDIEI